MFSKINVNLLGPASPERFKGEMIFQTDFSFYKLKNPYRLIPIGLLGLTPDIIRWVEISNNNTYARKSITAKSSLTFFLNSDNGLITFYNLKENGSLSSDQGSQIALDDNDIEYFGSVSPGINDAYLFDATQLHRTTNINSETKTRIQLIWKTRTYQEVLNQINSI